MKNKILYILLLLIGTSTYKNSEECVQSDLLCRSSINTSKKTDEKKLNSTDEIILYRNAELFLIPVE